MTNWHSPSLVLKETVALVKLVHVMGGLYIWEFVSSLGYEYSIMTGRRKFTWSSPFYVAARWFTLLFIIIEIVALDTSLNISCQAVITLNVTFATLSLLSASTLVILRTFALWERSRPVIVIGSTLWLANATSYIYSISTFPGHRINGVCVLTRSSRTSIIGLSAFITDFVLLALMLAGVLRWPNSRRRGGIWWLLYTQGLVWVVVFTLAELPALIFVLLDLNDPMNLIFSVLESEWT
ncbi:hypothetical protein BC827DRAFT_707040 [Russula dissimulans]|nr:hypothetical protein BC827DRAFT_707040 [Russula dissimulans]